MNQENPQATETTHFGYKEVPVGEKQHLVGQVFDSVAEKYDIMNDVMSMGVHRLWKRFFVQTCQIRPDDQVLDLAGGTGDIAALIYPQLDERGRIVLSDINPNMLAVGRRRLIDRGMVRNLEFVEANAEQLPFEDNRFDLVTIAFGLRNVTHQDKALAEMLRVLKPGGKARILEFSRVQSSLLARAYDAYSFGLLPAMGQLVAKDAESYRYLAESIRKHPDQETLAEMMRQAGFSGVRYQNLNAGIVAIHTGYKA